MATPSGGKIRSKRSHNTRKPYERPRAKSLLSRVSETVKDLITPSWLNNLWTNPNDDDGEDPSSRSSTPELPQTNQMAMDTPNSMPAAIATSTPDVNLPRGKEALSIPRQRPQATVATPNVQSELSDDVVRDGAVRNDVDDDDDDDVVIIDEEKPSTSAGVRRQTPLPFRNYADPIGTSTPNDDLQMLGGRKQVIDKDDASDTSVSTSGCSSLVPHLDKVDHKEKLSKKNLDRLSEMGHSSSLATSSLWTEASTAGPSGLSLSRPQQPIASCKRPSFNSSYFGSPRLAGELRPKNASPFYPGKTQFGGSASQRSSLKRGRTSPYEVHLPIKRNVRPKPANVGSQEGSLALGATSSTARKILDTLERMSTPLLDAKKIPMSPAASPYSFRPSSRLSRPGTSRINEPPVTGLRTAQKASIAPNRQPPVTTVIDLDREERVKPSGQEVSPSTTAPRAIGTASSLRFGPPSSTSTPAATIEGTVSSHDKGGGKMKSKGRNTLHYTASKEDDVVEVPDLPQVDLPLKSLPTFNFGAPQPSSISSPCKPSQPSIFAVVSSSNSPVNKTTTTTTATIHKPAVPAFKFSSTSLSSSSSKMETDSSEMQFKFSSPINKEASTELSATSDKSSSTTTTFKFSLPRQTPYSTSRPISKVAAESKKPSFETPERTRRKDDDDDKIHVVDEEEDNESGGIKVAKELKTGSCLEAFGILPTKNGPIPSSSTIVQAHANKVSKSPVDNGPSLGSAKLRTGKLSEPSELSNSIVDKFKPPASSWECDACMLMNKGDAETCVACATPKPSTLPQKPSSKGGFQMPPASKPSPVFNSLANKFGKQSNEWECDTCMIQNKDSMDKCAACSTPRPGGVKTNSTIGVKPAATAPLVNNVIADKFKAGAGEWECDTCMIRNKGAILKCVACETPKPGNQPSLSAQPVNIADKFKAGAGEWECDTCMIRNKGTILKCVACETPKPGSQPSLSAPPASSFKFGSTPLSNGDSSGAFKFGGSESSSTLNSNINNASSTTNSNVSGVGFNPGGFQLPTGVSIGKGTATTDVNGTSSSSGGFKLPAGFSLLKQSDSSAKTTEQKTTPIVGLSFGDKAKCDEKSSAKLEVQVPTGLKFGSSSESNSSAGLEMGATGGLKFGQSDSSKTSGLSDSITGGFKFGQSPPTAGQSLLDKEGPPPNVNIFQSKVTEEDGPVAKRKVTFGAASENGQNKATGAAAPSFAFGATTKESTPTASAQPFQFGVGAGVSTFGSAKTQDITTSSAAESKAVFSFGGVPSSSSSVAPSTTPSFSFGNSASKSEAAPTASSASGNAGGKPSFGFTFGAQNMPPASQVQPAAPSLSFSAKPEASAAATTQSSTFGQATTQQPATAATPSTGPAVPSFNFGASAAPAAKTQETTKPATFSFGSQNQNSSQAAPSGFSFGGSTASTSAPAQTTPSFNFGGASKAPTTTASGGFNFGSTPSATSSFTGSATTAAPTFGGFGSASSSTNPSPAFGAPPASSAFGSNASGTTPANSNPFGGNAQTNATPFGASAQTNATPFGAQTNAKGPAFGPPFGSSAANNGGSAFGSGTGSLTNSTSAFGTSGNAAPAFGSGTGSSFGSSNANPAPGGFQFGKTQATPSFQFGATNNAPATNTAFQFTGNQQNQAPQATPAVAPQPASGYNFNSGPPSFNFGGSTPQAGTTPFTFQGTPAPTESNPFNATGTPGAPSNRKIKRAVRRTARR